MAIHIIVLGIDQSCTRKLAIENLDTICMCYFFFILTVLVFVLFLNLKIKMPAGQLSITITSPQQQNKDRYRNQKNLTRTGTKSLGSKIIGTGTSHQDQKLLRLRPGLIPTLVPAPILPGVEIKVEALCALLICDPTSRSCL